jgi:two-component system sensor histidine kinase BaeS
MKRRFPLTFKLGLSFAIVILLTVALVYFLTAQSITRRFDDYRQENREVFGETLASQLAWYYGNFGSWVGVYNLLYRVVPIQIGDELYEGRVLSLGGRFSLANEEGRVFLTTEYDEFSKALTEEETNAGIAIVVDGARVGTLQLLEVGSNLDPREREFLASAKQSALIGGGLATGLALILSVFLIMQILSPLKKLTRATERIAHGDLPASVRFKARDEFGQLGDSFNHMIESLRRSETLRQTMTADIAHELRTPVMIIQGTLEALLDGVYEPTGETIAPIYEETLHLGRLIDDLRDLALAEAGELHLEKEWVDLEALTRQVAETATTLTEASPAVHIRADSALPSVKADPKRLRQVLANLLSNALRYTPVDGNIQITLRRVGQEVELRISDTGRGIAEEDRPHLFERFYRGDPARNRGGGSGLGLAIVKQWIEAHGGRIWVENGPGGGAQFTLRLPAP